MTTTGTAQVREADLLLGRKAVWEFDPLTRGWKICVDADVNITDIQIGAVEIKDHTTADRAHVDPSNLLHVFDHASTGAFILVWVTYDYPEDSAHSSGDYLAFVGGVRQHVIASPVGAEGDYQGFIFNNLGQLHTYTTGSHAFVDSELPEALTLTGSLGLTPIAPYAGALGFAWDSTPQAKGWVPLQASDAGQYAINPPQLLCVKSFLQAAGQGTSTSYNLQVLRPDNEYEASWISNYAHLKTAAILYAYDGSGSFARLEEGLLRDTYPNPFHALETAAFAMGYYPASGTWSRLTVDENDFLEVTLGTRLDELTDEVTAYVTGSIVVESLPLLGTMNDNMSNPNLPGVASFNVIYDGYEWQRWWGVTTAEVNISSGGFFPGVASFESYYNDEYNQWRRVEGFGMDEATIDPTSYMGNGNPFYGAILYAWDSAIGKSGGWRQMITDTAGNLGVYLGVNLDETTDEVTAYVTGTVHAIIDAGDIEIGAVEIKDATTDDRQRVTADGRAWVNAWITGTVAVDTELSAAVALADNLANPTAGGVGAYNLARDDEAGFWKRVMGYPAAADNIDNDYFGFNMNVNAVIWGVNYGGDMDRMRSEGASGSYAFRTSQWALGQAGYEPLINKSVVAWGERELVVYFSGSSVTADTELPAAAALADAMANPTTVLIGSVLMGYNGVTYDRVYMGTSGSVLVDLATRLDATNDEVTAYVTGTVNIGTMPAVELVTGAAVNIHGQTRTIQRQIINITGSAGEYMLVTGIAGQAIKVTEVMTITSADTELIFETGWTGTWLTGKLSLPSDGDGFFCNAVSTPDQHHFETDSGDILVLRLVAGAQIGGWINYYYE